MAVDFSIKRVPDDVADRLRERARRNHRSLQMELLAILEEAVALRSRPLTVREVFEQGQSLGHVETGEPILATVRRLRRERWTSGRCCGSQRKRG
jgi:antitoxin FitA